MYEPARGSRVHCSYSLKNSSMGEGAISMRGDEEGDEEESEEEDEEEAV